MAYMPRGSLGTRIPGEGLDPAEARRIALGLAKAVAYLAERGYVHRDIKPDNILFDPADQPRLTDFGIAKSVDDQFWQQTRAGVALGTEGYWSPEQRRNAAGCTSAADVFSLGVVLYEMLTGQLPSRDTPGTVTDEAFADERLDPVMRSLLRRMLAADPGQRPAAAEVVATLEASHG
jgi:serine/threonine protein kinase